MYSANTRPREIGVLVFDDFQLLDAAGPISVFEMPVRGMSPPPYRLTVYSIAGGAVRSSSGVSMCSEKLPDSLTLDTLVVSGGEGTRQAMHDTDFLNAIVAYPAAPDGQRLSAQGLYCSLRRAFLMAGAPPRIGAGARTWRGTFRT